jgi:hypothetical protein
VADVPPNPDESPEVQDEVRRIRERMMANPRALEAAHQFYEEAGVPPPKLPKPQNGRVCGLKELPPAK